MSDLFDDPDDGDAAGERVGGAPICSCGVTAIPSESSTLGQPTFVCENPDCEAFGEEL